MRVAALNLQAYFNRSRRGVGDLPQLIADQKADVILLQECRRPWFDPICDALGKHSFDARSIDGTSLNADRTPAASEFKVVKKRR